MTALGIIHNPINLTETDGWMEKQSVTKVTKHAIRWRYKRLNTGYTLNTVIERFLESMYSVVHIACRYRMKQDGKSQALQVTTASMWRIVLRVFLDTMQMGIKA